MYNPFKKYKKRFSCGWNKDHLCLELRYGGKPFLSITQEAVDRRLEELSKKRR